MNFSKLHLGKSIAENVDVLQVQQTAIDSAKQPVQTQNTQALKQKQKQQKSKAISPAMSGTTYASEMRRIEVHKERDRQSSNWRQELFEGAEENDQEMHPYVDVMPPVVKREKKMVAQAMKAAKEKKGDMALSQGADVKEETMQKLVDAGNELAKERKNNPTKLVNKTKPALGTRYNKPTTAYEEVDKDALRKELDQLQQNLNRDGMKRHGGSKEKYAANIARNKEIQKQLRQ